MLRLFQRNVRISNPVELDFAEEEDPLWVFEMIYAGLVEGKKEPVSRVEEILRKAGVLLSDPKLRARVESGQISEARMEIQKLGEHGVGAEAYFTLLALSKDEADWVAAWKEVSERDINLPKLFTLLSYRFWSVGKVEFAIRVAEQGLKRVLKSTPDYADAVRRLKNNLAYYYAELRKPEDERNAREYSREAREGGADENAIDTEGYVLISYGKNAKEILDGVELCEKARRLGIPFHLYHKHINRAYERLKELGAV